MCRPPHDGQKPRPLHENGTTRSSPQPSQCKRRKPFAAMPQSRNHQGIDNRLIEADDRPGSSTSAIECTQRLGGMLRFYHRAAA